MVNEEKNIEGAGGKTPVMRAMLALGAASRTFLKVLIHIGGAVVLLLLTLLFAFSLTPKMEFKSERLAWLANRLTPDGLRLGWRDAAIDILRVDAFSKNIRLRVSDLCVLYGSAHETEIETDGQDALVTACFETFEWGVGVTFRNWKLRITEFAPLIATNGAAVGDLDRLRSATRSSPFARRPSGRSSLAEYARREFFPKWRVEGSRISLRWLNLKAGGKWIQGHSLSMMTSHSNDPSASPSKNLILRLEGDRVESADIRVLGLSSRLNWPTAKSPDVFVLDGGFMIHLWGDSGSRAPLRISSRYDVRFQDWDHFDFDLRSQARGQMDDVLPQVGLPRQARLRGTYRAQRVEGFVAANFRGGGSWIKSLRVVDCAYDLDWRRRTGHVACGPNAVRLDLRERAWSHDKALFHLRPTFDLRAANLGWSDAGARGEWNLDLKLHHLSFLRLELEMAGSLASPFVGAEPASLAPKALDATAILEIVDFARLVALLRPTPLAIPAPFNQLRGPIEMSASGGFSEQGGEWPFEARARLTSRYQKVFMTTGGRLDLRRTARGFRPSLHLDVALEDVRLSLPRTEPLSLPPKLLPDGRFRKGLARERESRGDGSSVSASTSSSPPATNGGVREPVEYRVRVATTESGGLRVATNLAEAPIPISIRYSVVSPSAVDVAGERRPALTRLSESPSGRRARAAARDDRGADDGMAKPRMRGKVTIGRTPVDIGGVSKFLERMQREAFLEYFDLEMLPNGERKIDGKFVVVNPDATISILLLGTLREPTVRFVSVPPASENQIIAALIFGRRFDEQDVAEQESAAALRTAVNDTALTLAQMYLLANTPIDNLAYDSETGRVIASVKLAGGTSLEFGGAGGGAGSEVGIRRRLARNVYLNTYVESVAQSGERLVVAVVEWIRRF